MEQNKTEKLIKQLLEAKKKHGADKLNRLFQALNNSQVSTNTGPEPCNAPAEGCGTGYYWSKTLCACVPEIG